MDFSSAESATFINNPGAISGSAAAYTFIQTQGDLGTSTFINNAAAVPGAESGWTEIDFGTTSGVNFIANGATLTGCQGGQVYAFGAGYKLNTNNGRTDLVRAKGITIESGAQFAFQPKGNQALTVGTVFTVLNNASTGPSNGIFANLPDG